MRRAAGISITAVALLAAGAAQAADKVTIAPPAPWVVPVAVPTVPAAGDDATVAILLRDEQYDLRPGKQSRYMESVYRINKPEGLSAGQIALTWNPDIETVTVHRLVIRRGDKAIDVLAGGQAFTVVRRETNLENAVLDGELTATLQPEGLQVGDVIDLAVTVARSDPAVGQHVEMTAASWNGAPIARAHLRASWPASLPMRLRSAGGLPVLKPVKAGGMASIELSMDGVKPLKETKGAPLRYQYGRLVEMSDLPNWSGVAALMLPLYTKASTLPADGPLQAEIQRIKAASSDPRTRAEAALRLVQDRIRYLFLGIDDGGLIPADAETSWSRRFGDCKGKTAMLLALLHGLDITAVPVLANTALGDGIDQRLPLVGVFNHVLVKATIGGRDYWLDGTRSGDHRLDDIDTPAFHWGMPVTPGTTALVAMMPPPLAEPGADILLRLDASAGISQPAPAHAERILRGDMAIGINEHLDKLSGETRDRALRDYWKGFYDFITPTKTSVSFDPDKRLLTLVMDGTAKMEWNDGYYETDSTGVGYKADFSREPGADMTAPYAVAFPFHTRVRETVMLPPGAFSLYHPDDINRTVGGISYRRHAEIKGNVFTVEEVERSVVPEFPAADAATAEAGLRELAKQGLYIRKPRDYHLTEAELTASLAATPTTANGFVDRGNELMFHSRYDAAIADFDKALALDPRNVVALADRGLARVNKGDSAAATRDFDAAAAIDPHNAVMLRGRAQVAARSGDLKAAIAALTSSLETEPANLWALEFRGQLYHRTQQDALAAADAQAIIKARPGAIDSYLLLANLARARGDKAEALRQAAAAVAANPDNGYAHVVAARFYALYDDRDTALRELDRAIAIKPSAYIFLNRSLVRPKADWTARIADLDAALKLEPDLAEAMIRKAAIQREQGDFGAAVATLTAAHAAAAKDPTVLAARGIAYSKLGKTTLAEEDFTAARTLATSASALNSLCWEKATANIALLSALVDCDAALKLSPDAADILDSRGLVLLQLGRDEEAIAAYDKALAKRGTAPTSLYGRAVAEARRGALDRARADRDAALGFDANVGADFAGYGVPAPASLTAKAPPKG
jgi:tetratricopeptide (TPR) repeat protein